MERQAKAESKTSVPWVEAVSCVGAEVNAREGAAPACTRELLEAEGTVWSARVHSDMAGGVTTARGAKNVRFGRRHKCF